MQLSSKALDSRSLYNNVMKAETQTPVRIVDPSEATEGATPSSMSDSIPLLAVVNAVLRNRIRIVSIAIILSLVVATYTLSRPRQYVSEASFSLQGSDSRRLSGIAAQFGLALPGNDAAQSPAYYVELLGSREILLAAAGTRYTYRRDGKLTNALLPDIYGIQASDTALLWDETVRRLRDAISTDRSRETGIVRVSAGAPSPILAQEILTRLVALLNDFNLKTRQSQAANERRFIERRMTEIGGDLHAAEDRLKEFRQNNRGSIVSVPELSLEYERLTRDLNLRQQVYTALAQNYEQARIDEVRDTPAITVIESPSFPVRPSSRHFVRNVLLIFLLALALGALPSVVGVLLSSKRTSVENEAAEFKRLRGEIIPWRMRRSGNNFRASPS